MSVHSSAAVRPYEKAALATLDKETRRFYKSIAKEQPASMNTISDYKLVLKHRPLTEIEKQDLDCAIKAVPEEQKLVRGWAIQTGIDCGVYALRSLVHCA